VALIGRANVGKSTFLNVALGEPLAIVSSRPQTTRESLLGVVCRNEAEIALIDCPGIHKPINELGHRMNATAMEGLRQADLVLFVTDVVDLARASRSSTKKSSTTNHKQFEQDRELLAEIPEETPGIIVVNKIDLFVDKTQLLPVLSNLGSMRPAYPIIPISCLQRADVERVLDVLVPLLPEGEHRYSPDTLTDRPVRYFVTEYIREQVIHTTSGEIPFAVAVTLDEFSEFPTVTVIKATISVEKDGQRAILIGRAGRQIREVGILSRQRIERLLQKQVHLELFVRTKRKWRDNRLHLDELGYSQQKSSQNRAEDRPYGRGSK
jgi:GTP-binding protein Era